MIFVVLLLASALFCAPLLSGIPDEPFYSSWICVAVLLAALIGMSRAGRTLRGGAWSRAETALAALFAVAVLSILWRLIAQHGIAYLGPMLHGLIVLGTDIALFMLSRRLAASGRLPAYILLLVAVAASAIAAEAGFTEYLVHRHQGDASWRVFAESTPDFTAAYLAMLMPPTLALFLGVPWQANKSRLIGYALAMLILIVLGYQAMTLLKTSSRFAIVSLGIGLLTFGVCLWRAKRQGMVLEVSSWVRLGTVSALLLLIGLAAAGTVAGRILHTSMEDNSTEFRLYTWRGAAKMAAANPVLGTGIGSWVEQSPRYAITGFTRLAHDSYLQMAAECGLPGLVALLAALGLVGVAGARGLSRPSRTGAGEFLAVVAPPDDRLILAGLLGGLAAAAVQNLIDSDWYVFFFGVTFWALAGLAAGMAAEGPPTPDNGGTGGEGPARSGSPLLGGGGHNSPLLGRGGLLLITALMLLDMAAQGIGAWYERQATAALAGGDSSTAEQATVSAMQWDPLNGKYAAMLGYDIDLVHEGRPDAAVGALRTAVRLEPSSDNERLLAFALTADHQFPAALAALRQGLKNDSVSDVSFNIRLDLARSLPPPQSIQYYQQLADVEQTPVGRIRAIGQIMPYQFPIADAAVGDADDAAQNFAGAALYYARAEADLEAYADQGGTTNIQRQVLVGDHPDPALDKQMEDLYARVMPRRIALAPAADQPALRARMSLYLQKFRQLVSAASQPGTQ